MKVLISGAGIAGPTLAYWLLHFGMEPIIVEKSPRLRSGGYVIDFWGAGFDVADRMGLLPEVRRKGFVVKEVKVVNASGERVSGFPVEAFTRVAQGRYITLARSDLAAIIFAALDGRVETIFGDSVTHIEQTPTSVRVSFEREATREFDLVIGADGLHSRVRELVFGPEERFEKYLGMKVAAFQADGYKHRDELIYMMYTEVGQQVGRISLGDDRTMFLFSFADETIGNGEADDVSAQKDLLRRRFAKSGWECPNILQALAGSQDFYFDRVSQIRMDPQQGLWTRGRVSLLGDAASCVSLLAGQGSALAMVGAYILAVELHCAQGDYAAAFARYQEQFGPFVFKKQKTAVNSAGWFAPKSGLSLFLRNQVMKLLTVPWVANTVFGRGFVDKIVLPDPRAQSDSDRRKG